MKGDQGPCKSAHSPIKTLYDVSTWDTGLKIYLNCSICTQEVNFGLINDFETTSAQNLETRLSLSDFKQVLFYLSSQFRLISCFGTFY